MYYSKVTLDACLGKFEEGDGGEVGYFGGSSPQVARQTGQSSTAMQGTMCRQLWGAT